MTSQQNHIQLLITEIDSVLQRTNPRLPWVMSGEVAQQRQVLERVRNFLVALQQEPPHQDNAGPFPGTPNWGRDSYAAPSVGFPGNDSSANMTPYEMMQTILREVVYLRTNLTPSGVNFPAANNQPQLTAELLQILMSRLQENLSQQIAQTLDSLRSQSGSYGTSPMVLGGLPSGAVPQYEQLQALRSRSDQMLVNLDTTLNVVFESLQRNIQSYQDALSQGLERMYNTGQQSEYTFKLLIDQLVQLLKQEASSYLLSSARSTPLASPSASNPGFPYAGTEVLSSEISGTDLTTPAQQPEGSRSLTADAGTNQMDTAIEDWLRSAGIPDAVPGTSLLGEAAIAFPSLELPSLDLSDLDLEGKSLNASDEDTTEIDAALKLLEDLNAEVESSANAVFLSNLEPQPAPSRSVELQTPAPQTRQIDAAELPLDQVLATAETLQPISSPPVALSDDAQIELDEFYRSLFGSDTPSEASESEVSSPDASPPETTAQLAQDTSQSQNDQEPPLFLDLPENLFEEAFTSAFETSFTPATNEIEPTPTISIAADPPINIDLNIDLPYPTESLSSMDVDLTQSSLLTDLFQNVPDTATRSVPAEPPIAKPLSVTDPALPSTSESQDLFFGSDLFSVPDSIEVNEDQFTRAAPDENLLPEATVGEVGINLELDDLTLLNLNEDLSTLEGTRGVPPTVSLEFTLDNLASDVSTFKPESSTLPERSPSSVFYQASPAIEPEQSAISFSELFGDAPSVAPLPAAVDARSIPPEFTLEETTTLLAESHAVTPTELRGAGLDDTSPFTLEGLDNLFSAAPLRPTEDNAPQLVPPPTLSPPMPPSVQPSPPILSVTPSPLNASVAEPMILEGMDDLFGDAPPISRPALETPQTPPLGREIPPFKPELYNPEERIDPPPAFQLEHLDNLFADAAPLNPSATPTPSDPTIASASIPNQQSLDAAFESLFGSPPPASGGDALDQHFSQKKKTS